MLYTIRREDIYEVMNAQANITALAEIFSTKPDEKATPSWSYVFISIPSDNNRVYSNKGNLMKSARVSFSIVCKKSLWVTETEERVIYDIIDEINNTIVNEWCTKISDWNGIIVTSISEDAISPLFTDDENRAYIVKDYIFNYLSKSDV